MIFSIMRVHYAMKITAIPIFKNISHAALKTNVKGSYSRA